MKKHRSIAFVGLVALLLAIAVWFALRPREPEYQGKKLSWWLQQTETWMGLSGEEADLTSQEVEARKQRVAIALQGMGTDALPHLIRRLLELEQRNALRRLVEWFSDRQDLLKIHSPRRPPWPAYASEAFRLLNTNAIPAIPELAELFQAEPTASFAGDALISIGAASLPVFADSLTNQSGRVRRLALQPEIAELSTGRANLPTDYGFSRVTILFNSKCVLAAASLHQRSQSIVEPAAWARVVRHPDPDVQWIAVEQLGRLGLAGAAGLLFAAAGENLSTRRAAQAALQTLGVETYSGAITRGPKSAKRLALVFTGHSFAEGGNIILTELASHGMHGSFFLTGDFLTKQDFAPIIKRVVKEGHYLGPHSDKHLLYCAWEAGRQTLVSRREFRADLAANIQKIEDARQRHAPANTPESPAPAPTSLYPTPDRLKLRYFLPPFEHYNSEVVQWALDMQSMVINFTPGTRSNADYTGEADKSFVSSQAIFESIVRKEREDPHGLNGFILLFHLGSGPGRKDKFHYRFGELLDYLAGKGYEFVRVDELLEPKPEGVPNTDSPQQQTEPKPDNRE